MHRIPINRGLFVTTSKYSPRATTIGIKTINGEEVKSWEKLSHRVYYKKKYDNNLIDASNKKTISESCLKNVCFI